MADATVKRGRPPVYTGLQAEKIVEMVKAYGALKTTQSLRARSDAKIAELRDQRVFPNKSTISFPTVLRLAKNAGVTLSVGRRPKQETVTA